MNEPDSRRLKLFGRDINMRSTFQKYDPCVTGPRNSIDCPSCMASLISDRFLGQKFARDVLSKKYRNTKNLFTYVLIADTIGCNLNCWFCYAWKYLDMNDAKKCDIHFLSPSELAKQFHCKIRKTADFNFMQARINEKTKYDPEKRQNILKHLKLELPFSRIRISGGEPIFSDKQVLKTHDEAEDLTTQTIRYWIDFFEELDKLVGKIKSENLINIATFDSDWQFLNHPVWLTEVDGRIMIRFDTSGIIFGKDRFADLFFFELERLHTSGCLNNLHIQIDYSFKGVTVKEFWWSQRKGLPTTGDNNDKRLDLSKHPQVKGLQNIIDRIKRYSKRDSSFRNCVSVTIEKGIDHDPLNKLWLYYPGAFDWEAFAAALNIEFSDVINCFDLNFGWNLNAKIHRYTNRGAVIELSNGADTIDTTSASIQELTRFRKANLAKETYRTLVYPVETTPHLYEETSARRQQGAELPSSGRNYWVITGSEDNLRVGLKHGLWGVKKYHEDRWSKVRDNDILMLYCTKPISAVIGYAVVDGKYVDEKPLWPNENPNEESKYPLRIRFNVLNVSDNWSTNKVTLVGAGIDFYSGINYVEPGKIDTANTLMQKLAMKLNKTQ